MYLQEYIYWREPTFWVQLWNCLCTPLTISNNRRPTPSAVWVRNKMHFTLINKWSPIIVQYFCCILTNYLHLTSNYCLKDWHTYITWIWKCLLWLTVYTKPIGSLVLLHIYINYMLSITPYLRWFFQGKEQKIK